MVNYEVPFDPYVWTRSMGKEFKCYICNEPGHYQVAAVTDSTDLASDILSIFDQLGLKAKIRPLFPEDHGMPDILIGACDEHVNNLSVLNDSHRETKIITPESLEATLR